MKDSAYRTHDLAAECERLRDQLARVTDDRDTAYRRLSAWTDDQRFAMRLTWGIIMGLSIVGNLVWLASHDGPTTTWAHALHGGGIGACVHGLMQAVSGHRRWWRGIGGAE